MESNRTTQPWRFLFPIALLIASACLVFGQLPKAQFVGWDDPEFVMTNPWLNPPSRANLAQAWLQPSRSLYTPLLYTAWSAVAALEHPAAGQWLSPAPFHWLNLAIHLTAAIAVLLLLKEFFPSAAACAGAIVFLIHPVQVEAFAWISAAKDLMCGALSVAALWQFVRFLRSPAHRAAHYSAATVLYALALLSKPAAVVVPLLAVVFGVGMLGKPLREMAKVLWPWMVLAIPIAVVARLCQNGILPDPPPIWIRPWIALDAVGFYVLHLIARSISRWITSARRTGCSCIPPRVGPVSPSPRRQSSGCAATAG